VGAAKTRTPDEILEAIEAGLEIVGETMFKRRRKRLRKSGTGPSGT